MADAPFSVAGITVPSAAELWNLLHLDSARAVAQVNLQYKGKRVSLTLESLEHHLTGDVSLAFSVLHYRHALFAVLDIDARFLGLLPEIRSIVDRIGGEELSNAVFFTSGSDAGRGKLVVTFEQPVVRRDARALIQYLRRCVRATEAAQGLPAKDVSAFPTERSGGIVRVLGRNIGREGPLEAAFSLDGELGLAHVRPLRATKLAEIVAALRDGIAPWAKHLIETPWLRPEGTYKHWGHMVALAREARRLYGPDKARAAYDGWLDRIKANSPTLSLPSVKRRDERIVLDRRDGAWQYSARPPSWSPLELRMRDGIPRGVLRIYNSLLEYARRKGLRPIAFGIDYERLAVEAHMSKSSAFRLVKLAEQLGVIVVHDRGSRDTKRARGECTILGLVGHGETADYVRESGSSDRQVRERLAQRRGEAK